MINDLLPAGGTAGAMHAATTRPLALVAAIGQELGSALIGEGGYRVQGSQSRQPSAERAGKN
jgi:hypothetical protein